MFDDPGSSDRDSLRVAEVESRTEVLGAHGRACRHADTTVAQLPITAKGHVPWWPPPQVQMFTVLVHVLTGTNRHAGHADILRENLHSRSTEVISGDLHDRAVHVARIGQAARHHRGSPS